MKKNIGSQLALAGKSGLFEYELGEEGTPIIKKSPLGMEYLKTGDVIGKCLSFKNGETV